MVTVAVGEGLYSYISRMTNEILFVRSTAATIRVAMRQSRVIMAILNR